MKKVIQNSSERCDVVKCKTIGFFGKVWPIHAATKSPTQLPLFVGFGIMNALPLHRVVLSLPLSLQFLARFKAQLIPSFFVLLSCLFFAHMEAAARGAPGSEFDRPFLRILAPASTPKCIIFTIFYCIKHLTSRSPCGEKKISPSSSILPRPYPLPRSFPDLIYLF